MPYPWERLRPPPQSADPFGSFNSRVTYYAPGPGDRMEGGFETSRPNPQTGRRVPSTLDDVRLGTSPFVTLASDPSRYGQTVKMGPLTYTSPIDRKSYTLPDVTGYVHDTGSAFRGRPDKLDVATGDYRGWSPQAASSLVTADAGTRTVTPLSGDDADRAMRPIGLPEPWRATGAGENPDDIAMAQGPPQQGRKMPTSLMDMFQPKDAAGDPTNFADALQARSNSLIGLGLGMLQPSNPLRGESSYGHMLQGYMGGAGLDQRQAVAAAQLKHQKAQDARQAAQDKLGQSRWEQTFRENQMTEAEKLARASGIPPGTPEHQAFIARAIQSKTEGDWAIQTDEDTGQKFAFNKRTLETRALPVPGGTAAAGPVTDWSPGATNAPVYGERGDYSGGAVAPARSSADAIPPAPPGVDRKEWKREQTKLAVQRQIAADAAKKAGGSIDPVSEDIDRSIAQISKYPGMTTGAFSGVLKKIPLVGGSTQAGEVESLISTVKASSSLEKLQQMRAQSPTGASGLGAVTQGEHALLQNAIGSLDQSQDAASVLYNLERIKRIRHEIIHGPGTAPPPRFAPPSYQREGGQQGTAAPSAPRPGFRKGGYVFKGGDPSDQNNWAPVK